MSSITFAALRRLLRDEAARQEAGVRVIQCGIDQGNAKRAGRVVIDGVDLGYYARGEPLPILPWQRRDNGLDFQDARIVVTHQGQRVIKIELLAGRLWATYADDEIGGAFITPETELGIVWRKAGPPRHNGG